MDKAFPEDELNPITCSGRSRDSNTRHSDINDVLGNFSLTLVDALDSFAIMRDKPGFEKGVRNIIQHVNFNKDSRVQVFEITIRALGALLSGHILASSDEFGFKLNGYNNELLELAQDLGYRLLPAFKTKTGIPYPRVHLQSGVVPWEVKHSCAAGAGTLILEFATLSRLTGHTIFETVARRALLAVWDMRGPTGLVGNGLDVEEGTWVETITGIGAGIDSFYEYLLKAYTFLGDIEYLDIFDEVGLDRLGKWDLRLKWRILGICGGHETY